MCGRPQPNRREKGRTDLGVAAALVEGIHPLGAELGRLDREVDGVAVAVVQLHAELIVLAILRGEHKRVQALLQGICEC
jgi:hypothetical protein